MDQRQTVPAEVTGSDRATGLELHHHGEILHGAFRDEAGARVQGFCRLRLAPSWAAPPHCVLCTQDAHVLDRFAAPLPDLALFSIETEPAAAARAAHSRRGITDETRSPPRYSSRELQCFERLRATLARALARGDLASVATVASASAWLDERHRPKRGFAAITAIAASVRALGVQVAHGGSLVGLLFDPDDPQLTRRFEACEARLAGLGFGPLRRFERIGRRGAPPARPADARLH